MESQTHVQTEPNIAPKSFWQGWPAACLVAAAVFILYLFMCGRATLWDRDEPRFARATVEMVQSGEYLFPTFNRDFPSGKPAADFLRPDKPILIYWLMSVPVRLLGPTEIACRFMGPLGTAISCLLIYYLGRRLFDPVAGLWAMVIYSGPLLTNMIGTAATADAALMPLNLGVLALAASALWSKGLKWGHVAGMAVLFGLAMLDKSPFGLLPLVAIGGMAVLNRFSGKPLRLNRKFLLLSGLAAAVGGVMFLAWFIPANEATRSPGYPDGKFLAMHFGRHIAQRATSPLEHHGGAGLKYIAFLPYYLVVIVATFFPWTLHLPGALSGLAGGRVGAQRAKVFLLGWILSTFVLMSLTVTKLPHYILTIFPALALAVAGAIRAEGRGLLSLRDRAWLQRGRWLFVPVAAGVVAVAAAVVATAAWGPGMLQFLAGLFPAAKARLMSDQAAGIFDVVASLATPLALVGLIMLAMAWAAVRLHSARRYAHGALVLVVGTVALQLAISAVAVPVLERHKISPAVAQAIRANVSEDVPIYWHGFEEPSFVFYVGRHVEKLNSEAAVAAWSHETGPAVLVIPRPTVEKLRERRGMAELTPIGAKAALNYSNGKFVDVVALRRQ